MVIVIFVPVALVKVRLVVAIVEVLVSKPREVMILFTANRSVPTVSVVATVEMAPVGERRNEDAPRTKTAIIKPPMSKCLDFMILID